MGGGGCPRDEERDLNVHARNNGSVLEMPRRVFVMDDRGDDRCGMVVTVVAR